MKVKIERIKDYFPCLLIKKRIVPSGGIFIAVIDEGGFLLQPLTIIDKDGTSTITAYYIALGCYILIGNVNNAQLYQVVKIDDKYAELEICSSHKKKIKQWTDYVKKESLSFNCDFLSESDAKAIKRKLIAQITKEEL